MDNRERYLTEEAPFGHAGETAPEWVVKEAAGEEDWESIAKKQLEIGAFARDLMRTFPAEKLSGVYQEDRSTGAKKLIKSTDEVLAEMFSWLNKKAKGDINQAKAILDATQLVDEFRNPIIQMFKNANEEDLIAEEDKAAKDAKDGQPANVLKRIVPSETTAEQVDQDNNDIRLKENKAVRSKREDYAQPLERKKIVGSYGLIVNEQTTQLWKKGELVAEVATDDVGGFVAMTEELDAMKTSEDALALFPEVVPTIQVGDKVIAHLKFGNVTGKVSELDGDSVLVLYDDVKNQVQDVELVVPKELVEVVG